jgi:GNAT superfamily N-acetyltransferase
MYELAPAGAVEASLRIVPAAELELRNGTAISIRMVTADDEPALRDFLAALSLDSRRLRFFGVAIDLLNEARRGAAGDDADHHGLLALVAGRGAVGHATFVRAAGSERAEVAVEVADDLHHLGLATLLMIRLARAAEARQISQFFAEVLPENQDMLAVFRDAFATVSVSSRDSIEVVFPTAGWRSAHTRFEPARTR